MGLRTCALNGLTITLLALRPGNASCPRATKCPMTIPTHQSRATTTGQECPIIPWYPWAPPLLSRSLTCRSPTIAAELCLLPPPSATCALCVGIARYSNRRRSAEDRGVRHGQHPDDGPEVRLPGFQIGRTTLRPDACPTCDLPAARIPACPLRPGAPSNPHLCSDRPATTRVTRNPSSWRLNSRPN